VQDIAPSCEGGTVKTVPYSRPGMGMWRGAGGRRDVGIAPYYIDCAVFLSF